jgi:tetratricopeptide (TPR) repeat protein
LERGYGDQRYPSTSPHNLLLLILGKEQDHLSRASRLTKALSLLESSIQDHPSSSAHFHLALALYKPIPGRDLARAIESARTAVELEPDNVRYWHLLGLLLAASEDWRGAREVLEVGATLDEQSWTGEHTPPLASDALDTVTIGKQKDRSTGIASTDNSSRPQPEPSLLSEEGSTLTERQHEHEHETILNGQLRTLPSPAELLRPLPDHPPPSTTDRFEHALQLRMTQLALTELIEGPEGTEENWIEVFQWFAKRSPEREQSREFSLRSRDVR